VGVHEAGKRERPLSPAEPLRVAHAGRLARVEHVEDASVLDEDAAAAAQGPAGQDEAVGLHEESRHRRVASPLVAARRLFLLEYGAEHSPKWVSVRGGGDRVLRLPVIGALVETDDGWVLLETGISEAFAADAEASSAVYGAHPPELHLRPPLDAALASFGVRVEDLALAALSHLHVDHAGGVARLAAAQVPIAVQRTELAFATTGPAGLAQAYYRPDYEVGGARWRELDGDAELLPGVHALLTPGHTPGHSSYRIDLPETGTWLLAMDAADLVQNLVDEVPGGLCADPDDAPRADASLRRLLDEARALDARLLPGHDGPLWRAARHPPGGWT